jgi:glycosyltransferase involved in cell wall biosynthesis
MGVGGRAVVIPNGIFPEEFARLPEADDLVRAYPRISGRKVVLFAGRLSREKGLDFLADAWSGISGAFPEHLLVIAGVAGSSRYGRTVRRLFANQVGTSVHFTGAVHGYLLKALYSHAELVVLPSRSEGFGNVVIQALACGTPVLTTTGTPWRLLEERGYGRCVQPSAGSLTEGLAELLSLGSSELRRMGRSGRDWALENFSWYGIGRQLYELIETTADGGIPLPAGDAWDSTRKREQG